MTDPGTSHSEPGEWIALPGLFEASELVTSAELELRALPLLLVDGRVFYGVYARERARSLRARSAA